MLESEQIKDISVRRLSDRSLLVALRVPSEGGFWQGGERKGETADIFELWAIDVSSRTTKRLKRFWNVKAAVAGPAGVFGLTHRGLLRRLVVGSFKTMASSGVYDRILAVGTGSLWLVREDGALVVADARNGAPRHVLELRPDARFRFRIDAVTDDLAYVEGEGFFLIGAADGRIREIGRGE